MNKKFLEKIEELSKKGNCPFEKLEKVDQAIELENNFLSKEEHLSFQEVASTLNGSTKEYVDAYSLKKLLEE